MSAKTVWAAGVLLVLAACGEADDPTRKATTDASAARPEATFAAGAAARPRPATGASLAARMDCLREKHGALVSAHRGGSTRDYPENALETLKRTFEAGSVLMEVDVSQAGDGTLFLMHDDTLDRTTSGSGSYAKLPWSKIAALTLKTYRDDPTPYHPPTLKAALDWAKSSGAILQLDKKRETDLKPILAAIREAGATANAVLITYTEAQAVEAHKALPDLYIAATINDADRLRRLTSRGVDPKRLIAWTGTETQDPDLWSALADEGVEVAFGATGARGQRLDDLFWKDANGEGYDRLVADGVQVISTDLSDKVGRAMTADDTARQACGF